MLFSLIVALAVAAQGPVTAETPGISRTPLQERDLSEPGRKVVQVRVDFAPGAVAPRHLHFREEVVYVLKGTLEYRIEGQPVARLSAGDVLFIPSEKPHSATNVGLDNASELATYIVEKDKPLVVPIK